jgi:hypothetical protein
MLDGDLDQRDEKDNDDSDDDETITDQHMDDDDQDEEEQQQQGEVIKLRPIPRADREKSTIVLISESGL